MPHESIRGRGAAHDPKNRFETLAVEREAWVEAGDPDPETRLYRDTTRTIIARNQSPDVGFETSVNPYRGCDRGCSYCMAASTPVLMADGTWRPLADLRVGDTIYGTARTERFRLYTTTPVLAHWQTRKPAFRVTLGDGTELTASSDHRFLTLRGWKFVGGHVQGRSQRPHLTTNDELLGVGLFASRAPTTDQYRLGYLCGMIRGDALLRSFPFTNRGRPTGGTGHQFRLALVDPEGLQRTADYLLSFGVETRPFVFSEAKPGRQRMLAIRASGCTAIEDIRRLISWPAAPSYNWSAGYLAGIFDAEGSFSGGVLRIANTEESIIGEATRALARLGFDTAYDLARGNRERPVTYIRVRGGLKEHLRFFHTLDPAIRRRRRFTGQKVMGRGRLRVLSIEPLGPADLFDITTGTGDFIADGVVSHNCFARPTHEFLGLSSGLDFETKIFVKNDAPELLRKELSSPKWTPQTIVMSGVTDPYQSAEKRLGITRRCLEVLVEFRNPVAIITKSHLVTRDADLLADLAEDGAATVALSITSLRRELQRVMEPRASSPERRLDAIRRLTDAGVPATVMVAPVIPGLTDHEMPAILAASAKAGAVGAGYVALRLPFALKELFEDWLDRHHPDRKEKVLNRLRSLHGGELYDARWSHRQRGAGPFAEQLERMFDVACRASGLDRPRAALSTAAFRRPPAGGQLALFGGPQAYGTRHARGPKSTTRPRRPALDSPP